MPLNRWQPAHSLSAPAASGGTMGQQRLHDSPILFPLSLPPFFEPTQGRGGAGLAGPQAPLFDGGAPQARPGGGGHFNQPRRRKYHIGPSALSSISSTA